MYVLFSYKYLVWVERFSILTHPGYYLFEFARPVASREQNYLCYNVLSCTGTDRGGAELFLVHNI